MSPSTSTGTGVPGRRGRRGFPTADGPELQDRSLGRQYVIAAVIFVVIVAAIVLLFGHMISRTLSRRYLEDTLISGQAQARQLAQEMAGEGERSIYEVVERRRETLLKRGAELAQRQVFERIVIRDKQGHVVWEGTFQSRQAPPGQKLPENLELSPDLKREVKDSEKSYELHAPIGDMGEVVLLASKDVLASRIARLRHDLLLQTVLTAALTVLALAGAFVLIWHLVQRNRWLEVRRHEAQELADLGALAANLAHEIRNPLNSINLNLELLDEDLAGMDEGTRTSLDSTRREVGRLARLVTDFLTYARPSNPVFEVVRLDRLFEEVGAFLRAEASRQGVHLRVVEPPRDLEIHGDPAQLRQVLLNLILNAVQAVSGLAPERRVVTLRAERDTGGETVRLVVHDRGDGIPEGEMGQVRQAFFSNRRGGTGLGLAIAERIAASHGGSLELENVDDGFEARIVLPTGGGGVSIGDGSGSGEA